MDLNTFKPDNNEKWIVKNNYLFYNRIVNIPVCYIQDDNIYIFLDLKISKQVIKLVKKLSNDGLKFYFTTPGFSNPKGIKEEDYHYCVIHSYLYSYANKDIFDGFRKINFSLIDNLVSWCKKENCFNVLKEVYDEMLIEINKETQNWYFNSEKYFLYRSDIRDEFRVLWREILLSNILS